jgi:hypothetical protein
VFLVTWQALRGQSIINPDATTLLAFLALLLTTAVSSLVAWRQPRTSVV